MREFLRRLCAWWTSPVTATDQPAAVPGEVARLVAQGARFREYLEATAEEMVELHAVDPTSYEADQLRQVILSGYDYQELTGQ